MIRFANLYERFDTTTKTNDKVAALVEYLRSTSPSDAAWATYFLTGNKLRQLVPTKLLREWAREAAGIPDWLFAESYDAVGDLAETLTLVVPPGQSDDAESLSYWIERRLLPLREMSAEDQKAAVLEIWQQTPAKMRLVVMKLITGAFRIGVSKQLVVRAIAEFSDISSDVIAHRLMGNWQPSEEAFARLIDPNDEDSQISRPYPFCLAHPLEPARGPESLGDVSDYVAEWKWDGIRGQIVRRHGKTFLWSRGDESMEGRWPEIEAAADGLPNGTVLDGEILAATTDGLVLPFAHLQRRIGRKTVTKKILHDVPVSFYAFDLLEYEGVDVRHLPWFERRQRLDALLAQIQHPHLKPTVLLPASDWTDWERIRRTSRENSAEGLMIKRRDAAYDVGRIRGTWWKWKVAPYSIDAVLIYAQKGHGKRANLYTDYTFALWDQDNLVPFAKAYSGLTDEEIREVDRFVRTHTKEAFGPVRSVTPTLVMELAFEGLQRSTRHKSGIATRFPRILRWRHDKRPQDANNLSDLFALLPGS